MVTVFKMNFRKLIIFFALVFSVNLIKAQDKIVFKNGKKANCKIVAINPHSVTYKDSANAENLITVPKGEVLMAEYKSGSVYIFGSDEATKTPTVIGTPVSDRKKAWRDKEATFSNNILGFQIPDPFWGRLTLTYERLLFDKQVGFLIPASLTYDARALLFAGSTTNPGSPGNNVSRNVSFITGADINYYFETKGRAKFYVGPRFRYGTDVTIENVTAYSFQFQNGLFFPSANGKMANTLSLGFGFARIISLPGAGFLNPKQAYPWASFSYRLGFRL